MICKQLIKEIILLTKKEQRKQFIKEHCIVETPFIGHSGEELSWRCDLIKAHGYFNDFMRELVPFAFDYQNLNCPKLAGIELGGFLLTISHTAMNDGGEFFDFGECILVRKDGTILDLGYPSRRKVILVDDVVTTGNSLLAGQKALEENGYEVFANACVLDRRPKEEREKMKVYSLFTNEDFDLPPK